MNHTSDIAEIKLAIDNAIERLDDTTFSLLREASRESGTRPVADKTLLQSRRALEKASRLLATLVEEG